MVVLEEAAECPAPRRPEEDGDPDIRKQEERWRARRPVSFPGRDKGNLRELPADRVRRLDSLLCRPRC